MRGAVQGVGFRPFVYRRATALGLHGWVGNGNEGVWIEAEGSESALHDLIEAIRNRPPPNASVDGIEVSETRLRDEPGFSIRESMVAGARAPDILPDLATCADCLRELFDPADRRYRYPFINCTQCGPRYSIVRDMPYDRSRTAMQDFALCDACKAEYANPEDRRFHAEPNACPVCGPRLALWSATGIALATDDAALLAAADAIRRGAILAVKGIGGFHLFADACNELTIRRLRAAKRREAKPFAVMFPDLASVRANCRLGLEEQALLTGPAAPILLLNREAGPIAPSVAPGNPRLGALFPYAPLHHLLMHELRIPVVATSGNISDEPIVTDEREALERLESIAELFLVHNRPIVRAVEDSVVQMACGSPQILRRARGYAPAPIMRGELADGILAYGGHLKSTVALVIGGSLVLGQHVGDLESATARDAHAGAVDDIVRLYAARPRFAVRDMHPDYASSRAADASGLPVRAVQHHVAHVAACMAEHDIAPPVLGVAWDGAGYGPDGTVWGGEFLHVTESGWRRVGHLRQFQLPGGEAAIREPRRAALGLLFAVFGEDAFAMTDLAPAAAFSTSERKVLCAMLKRGVNAPLTSSAGRLFDAFAALCGLCQRSRYGGEGASLFESVAHDLATGRSFDIPIRAVSAAPLVVDWEPALRTAVKELRAGVSPGAVSEALHNGLAAAIAEIASRSGERRVVLTGGCFQNVRLTEASVAGLRAVNCVPYWHRHIPPNDGGIAAGQAFWAACHTKEADLPCV